MKTVKSLFSDKLMHKKIINLMKMKKQRMIKIMSILPMKH